MRARRSCLSVPATQPHFHEKADRSAADMVFLDLEDSVAPAAKERARGMAVGALKTYRYDGKVRGVRVNDCDSPWCHDDIAAVVEGCGDRLDVIVLPKVEGPEHVHFADLLLNQLERKLGLERRIGLELQIESARGLDQVERVAGASARTATLVFGPGDLQASLGIPTLSIGRTPEDYPGEFWHAVHFRILVAARARGLQAIDGPYAAVRDVEGLRASARRSAAVGFDGKWALTPAQAEVLNEVYAPSQADFDRASAIVGAYARATDLDEKGAVMLGDEMIDEASRKLAAAMVERGQRHGMAPSRADD
jgi:citrate lyase subunit beta/citryl-CoA lyase